MATEPKLYTRNYVDAGCTFTFSHGSTNGARIYDGEKTAQYITSGANSDSTDGVIQIGFYEGGVLQTRVIDTLMILGHNVKYLDAEYYNATVGWQTIGAALNITTDYTIISFAAVSATGFRVYFHTTRTANQEKKIGELIACAVAVDPGVELDSYDVNLRPIVNELTLADGSTHRTLIKFSTNRTAKYEMRGRLSYLSTTVLALLQALKDSGALILWQPESISRPDEVYTVYWAGSFHWKYVTTYKGAGLTVDLDLREV